MTTVVAYLALAGFGWLAMFQFALAFGTPWGNMAWGGTARVLSPALRWASLVSALVATFGVALALDVGNIVDLPIPGVLIRPALGAFAVLFALSFLANLKSNSRVERRHGIPLSALLTVSCAILFLIV